MRKKTLISLTCLLLFTLIYMTIKIYSFGNKNKLIKADAAIVLGAASWGKNPSPIFKERINHAIWLYKNNFIDKIIFTGGKDSKNEQPAAVVAASLIHQLGIRQFEVGWWWIRWLAGPIWGVVASMIQRLWWPCVAWLLQYHQPE